MLYDKSCVNKSTALLSFFSKTEFLTSHTT